MSSAVSASGRPDPQDEVVSICRDLLRIDTTNPGDGSGPGERAAAELVAELLAEVGLEPQLFESEPGRASVVVRVEGDPAGTAERGALLLHGHLDVVPARADDWSVHPFSGEVTTETTDDPETPEQEFLWGRGAVDMKDMDAMLLAVVRDLVRRGERPPRDLVLAFMADEEAGGVKGAHWLVDHHAGLFEGVTAAVSEVGGFSTTIGTGSSAQRTYLLQTAEKGIAWLRLVAHGRAGHGSQVNTDNAVTRLCEAVARIGSHPWPVEVTPTVRAFLDGVTDITGVEFDPADPSALLDQLGTTARWVGATLRDTANPTLLEAGYKHNVIPGTATALLDCRFLPGHEERLVETVRELAGEGVEVQDVHRDVALETDFAVPLVDRMVEALHAEDPGARVLPYCLSGGTDNKSFSQLGIPGYGFAPLRLPAGLDFAGLFHGVDERVPLDALRFGTRVLQRFVASA
ncbi:M20/M25/M40 family metallo-hydrolase [Streptomyces sp. NP160]|uniref:M20/M25/M40 family metallo-hydrolase n=1 Tax=Streptomyces sp. NP160 TaxID=2586637 RepID=UPI0011190D10|nr:M20/M25/M40 family metallo-hydrolase [Streptomyces sp. NP160]TNM70222.1 M20/M25/M40 family metallo-hydrolase [Streptomyces sp. NP160]